MRGLMLVVSLVLAFASMIIGAIVVFVRIATFLRIGISLNGMLILIAGLATAVGGCIAYLGLLNQANRPR